METAKEVVFYPDSGLRFDKNIKAFGVLVVIFYVIPYLDSYSLKTHVSLSNLFFQSLATSWVFFFLLYKSIITIKQINEQRTNKIAIKSNKMNFLGIRLILKYLIINVIFFILHTLLSYNSNLIFVREEYIRELKNLSHIKSTSMIGYLNSSYYQTLDNLITKNSVYSFLISMTTIVAINYISPLLNKKRQTLFDWIVGIYYVINVVSESTFKNNIEEDTVD